MNTFAAYLAGVIDSDGAISIAIRHSNRPTPSYVVLIQLSWAQTEKVLSTLEKIKSIYGGAVYTEKNNQTRFKNGKDLYRYCIGNKASKKLLEDILPFLHLKKNQCENALELINTTEYGSYGNKRPKPEDLKIKHHNLYLNNKELNTKNSGERRKNV